MREERGLSQLVFTERIGMSNSVFSRIESGKRPIEDNEINIFADLFEVSGIR
ncbi:helix-turn-helix transcriptional regulator [Paenibacillus sp. PvP094]|uniref:helix-turn-helix domain-containing protein n=1 Tax=Paenibacillus sp. PvP094 TaxID=3156394 RepID=UPI0033955473